jgi:hypothetical protein
VPSVSDRIAIVEQHLRLTCIALQVIVDRGPRCELEGMSMTPSEVATQALTQATEALEQLYWLRQHGSRRGPQGAGAKR